MTAKEQNLIKKSFKDGFFHVFDNNEDAKKVHDLLNQNDVKHEYGEYLHKVGPQQRYNLGIRVTDSRKLQDLINSPAEDDNPVKDMERLRDEVSGQGTTDENAGAELKEEAAEGTETATRPVDEDAPAKVAEQKEPAETKSAPKKKRTKKVNL